MTEHHIPSHGSRRRWPWVLLILLAGVVGTDQIYRFVKHSQVRHELAALRKEGIPVTEQELEVWYAPVPDKENAALRVLEACGELISPGEALGRVAWGRTDELGPQDRDELKQILTNNTESLEIAHKAVQLKSSRYPVAYSLGPAALLPHLAKIKSLCQVFKAEAVVSAEEGQLDAAVKAVTDSVLLARTLDTEPLLISQLVRNACLAISSSTVERLLNQTTLTDGQLQQISTAFADAEAASADSRPRGFIGEVCLGSYCFTSSPRRMVELVDPNAGGVANSAVGQIVFPLYAWTGLRDRDYLFYLRTMHRVLDSSKTPFPAALAKANETANLMDQTFQKDRLLLFSRMLLPALQKAETKGAEMESRFQVTRTALAIERYRLAHKGAPPEDLKELTPAFLQTLPLDPFDGAALRYRKLDVGYIVYSIGPDLADDGGLERNGSSSSGARQLSSQKSGGSPARKPSSGKRANSNSYDVTFIVER